MDTNFKKITGQMVNRLLTIDKSFPNNDPKKEYLYILHVTGINRDFANNLEIPNPENVEKCYAIYRLKEPEYAVGYYGLDELNQLYPQRRYLRQNEEAVVNG